MARYIDRQDVIDCLTKIKNSEEMPKLFRAFCSFIESYICDIPTDEDVVKVVRCKDCELRKTENCAMYYECNCGEKYTWDSDNDYCSWSVSKED